MNVGGAFCTRKWAVHRASQVPSTFNMANLDAGNALITPKRLLPFGSSKAVTGRTDMIIVAEWAPPASKISDALRRPRLVGLVGPCLPGRLLACGPCFGMPFSLWLLRKPIASPMLTCASWCVWCSPCRPLSDQQESRRSHCRPGPCLETVVPRLCSTLEQSHVSFPASRIGAHGVRLSRRTSEKTETSIIRRASVISVSRAWFRPLPPRGPAW